MKPERGNGPSYGNRGQRACELTPVFGFLYVTLLVVSLTIRSLYRRDLLFIVLTDTQVYSLLLLSYAGHDFSPCYLLSISF